MSAAHTPGLLRISTADGSGDALYVGGMVLQSPHTAFAASASTPSALAKIDRDTLYANARRLAACWNSFDGINTELIEAVDALGTATMPYRLLVKSHADLLAALQEIADGCRPSETYNKARAAIAKAVQS